MTANELNINDLNINDLIRRHGPPATDAKRILFIAPNPATLKGIPVGVFAEELTGAFTVFVKAGHEVDVRSPAGGKVEFDAMSDPENEGTVAPDDLATIGFSHHRNFGTLLADTKSIDDVDVSQYDAVCVAGGGAPLINFKDDTQLHRLIAEFYEAGKVVGLICHGTCLLLWTRLSDGTLLADGRTWTGYPDSEEQILNESIGMTVNDYTIETEAKKNPNTTFESGPPYASFAIRDGRLITAQQQNSTGVFADLVLEALADA